MILIACEESQTLTIELRKNGFEAFSCDIQNCSGGHPEWHIKADVIPLLNGYCSFYTCDGVLHSLSDKWEAIVAFPPCTYLTNAGNRYFNSPGRDKLRNEACEFVDLIWSSNTDFLCIENPCGFLNKHWRPPSQTVHPYFFCDSVDEEGYILKRTCFWLRGFYPLERSSNLPMPEPLYLTKRSDGTIKKRYSTEALSGSISRSKLAPSFARAIVEQWFLGNYVQLRFL